MKFGVVAKVDKKEAVITARKVVEFLSKKAEIVVEEQTGKKIGRKGLPLKKMKVDIVVTVGGDGTILRTLQSCNVPVFGINAGAVGFLTEVKLENAVPGLNRILRNDYVVDKRIKIRVMLNSERLYDCVNEVVIHTAHVAKMRHFEIFIDNVKAEDIRADGIIVATPTGSTCYAMSVGSPILDPRVDAFVIAPIAPFKLSARPIVVPAKSRITITCSRGPSLLVLDGQYEREVEKDDVVSFTASKTLARFIRFGHNFYRRVKEGLIL